MTIKGIGRKSVEKIMKTGVSDIKELNSYTTDQYMRLGLNIKNIQKFY